MLIAKQAGELQYFPPISQLVFFPQDSEEVCIPSRDSGKEFPPGRPLPSRSIELPAVAVPALSDCPSEAMAVLTGLQLLWPPCCSQRRQACAPRVHLLPSPPETLLP